MSVVERVTAGTFESDVLNSDRPVLVELCTTWCPSCRVVEPLLERLADEVQGRAKVVKVNVEEEGELASAFGIRARFNSGLCEETEGSRARREETDTRTQRTLRRGSDARQACRDCYPHLNHAGIRAVPTLVLFRKGEAVAGAQGAAPMAKLRELMAQAA
ncbi:MAG: hypothetical protein HYY16_16010 [Planctomycetes bacterium]|nr:hypothetical protein [Planctomycetota bacterium]